MKLTDSRARYVAKNISQQMIYTAGTLTTELGRDLSEDEAFSLRTQYEDKLFEVLTEFEFDAPEQVVNIDPIEAWCEENRGRRFKRPNGKVIYTVTGEALRPNKFVRYSTVLVCRSSDGREQPMFKTELLAMDEVVDES